jgi:hypothetical protein
MIWAFDAADNGVPSFPIPSLPHLFETMPQIYRVTKSPEVGDLVDSIRAAEAFARENGPGRYVIDEHAVEPFPGSKSTARGWGSVIHRRDGN